MIFKVPSDPKHSIILRPFVSKATEPVVYKRIWPEVLKSLGFGCSNFHLVNPKPLCTTDYWSLQLEAPTHYRPVAHYPQG